MPRKTTKKNVEKKARESVVQVELGKSGTLITSGIISNEDYNQALTGTNGIREYEKMRNDATVHASLEVIKLTILAANWYIQPGDTNDERYEEQAEFVRSEMFENIEPSFSEFIREALCYLDYGRYVFEIVYRIREDGMIGWKKFAPRMPKTILYWQMENGEPGIQQILPSGGTPSIPLEKIIILTNRKEGDNYEGRSLLRTSYRNWYTKDALYKIQAIALERQGVGIPYVKVPKGASPADILKAEEFLRNIRANEESYLTWKDGWEFGFLDMSSNSVDASDAIAHHNREIVKNVLAQFLELGSATKGSGSGSFALSKDQSKLFILSLQYIANYICEVISNTAIKRLIDMNFGPQEYYPKLKVSKIGEIDFAAISSALSSLVGSEIITPDDGLEDHLRDIMNLPELSDEDRAKNEFDAFMEKLDEQDQAIDSEQNAIDAQDAASQDMQDAQQQDIQASEDSITAAEVLGVVFTGAAGTPLSEEHRQKIRESLLRWWSSRKKGKTAKKGRKSKVSDAEKARKKQVRDKVKSIRAERSAKIKEVRAKLRKQKFDARQKVLEMKLRGEKPSKEFYAKQQLELLKTQRDMLNQIDRIESDSSSKISVLTGSEEMSMQSVINIKSEVDNVIEKLTKNIESIN